MKLKLKRFIAFTIDIFIVSIICEALSTINFINIYRDDYLKTYNEYQEIYDSFENNQITLDQYNENVIYYNYELSKDNIISYIIYIVIFTSYFVGLNCLYDGQTLGKKLMNIKIESKNNKKLNAWTYILRTILLTGIFGTFVLLILVFILKEKAYYDVSFIISLLQYILQLIICITTLLNKEGRGLHDIICKTKVVDLTK